MSIPTQEHIIKQIKNGIKFWKIHNCTICNYPIGFIFNVEGNNVIIKYDNSCDCGQVTPRIRTIDDIINKIKCNKKEHNKFWNWNEFNTD